MRVPSQIEVRPIHESTKPRTTNRPWPPDATRSTRSTRVAPAKRRRPRRSELRAQTLRGGLSLGDTHSNIGQERGSGSFMEPRYSGLKSERNWGTRMQNRIPGAAKEYEYELPSSSSFSACPTFWFEPRLYYDGHRQKLEALIDLFQQHGVSMHARIVHVP